MDEDDLLDMMALQEIIVQNLSDKEIFRTHTPITSETISKWRIR